MALSAGDMEGSSWSIVAETERRVREAEKERTKDVVWRVVAATRREDGEDADEDADKDARRAIVRRGVARAVRRPARQAVQIMLKTEIAIDTAIVVVEKKSCLRNQLRRLSAMKMCMEECGVEKLEKRKVEIIT